MGTWMRMTIGAAALGALGLLAPPTQAQRGVRRDEGVFPSGYADADLKKSKPKVTPERAAEGKKIYTSWCSFCHGEEGDGKGPVASYLDPRPRDFTSNLFKFRTTTTGELPTDEDLYRTVSLGVPGTAMPAWGEGNFRLSAQDRWKVVFYIKTLAEDFGDPDLSPYNALIDLPAPPPKRAELIARGRELYQDKTKGGCVKCHGPEGRGDGPEAGAQQDDWGFRILAQDLTRSWRYKNWGSSPEQIFRTLSTGINGTPMPGYADSLSEEERWALAYYVDSLVIRPLTGDVVLPVPRAEGELPTDPKDPRWAKAPALYVRMSGQVVVSPRWQNPSVDMVHVQAFYNEKGIALRLTWDDRFKDVTHEKPEGVSGWESKDSYVKVETVRKLKNLRDAIALEFPTDLTEGPQKPYFMLGQSGRPVNLWEWRADWNEKPETHGGRTVIEAIARSFKKPPKPLPKASQNTNGRGAWERGQWTVVLTRSLTTQDTRRQIQFRTGPFIPFAVHAWDGSNGEFGLLRSISSWHYLKLQRKTPASVYAYGLLGGLLAVLFEGWVVRRVKRVPIPGADEANREERQEA
ncbi:MAG: c-type cytochrome [Nitrospinota bacterium]